MTDLSRLLQTLSRAAAVSVALALWAPLAGAQIDEGYPPAIKSIVEQRCVVCHGCYDAPCQLKLDDWIGVERGGSKKKVYDGTRLLSANLTRLYEDALTTQQWREREFHPVLDRDQPEAGLVYRMLALKEAHPLPTAGPLPDSFDFSLARDQVCAAPEEFGEYREERPLQGMPYGFPGLNEERLAQMREWLKAGAPGVPLPAPPAAELALVADWEDFLNGADNRARLMSRYIFEHLFIGHLHFDELPAGSHWYKLVRSRTPPGAAIDLIATRRPYDDPEVERFYYRLQARPTSILAKRHMPYALNARRMARWRELFLEPDYAVEALPGYDADDSANPFITFRALPVNARYRFMLDEAHFTIMAYIKGPVCRGQVALNVIDDHFWVAFIKPGALDPEQHADFLAKQADKMRLPAGSGSMVVSLLQWKGYAKDHRKYLRAEARAIAESLDRDSLRLNLDLIWKGGPEKNDNAALTVFRHFDSASVIKGLVGQQPSTMWIIDYSLLERIHYLLVAGFDVYGNLTHQLESRLYMDFLRMEGEQNFLLLLPAGEREEVRDHWYRGAEDHVKDYLLAPENAEYERDTDIRYATDNPKSELMAMLQGLVPAAKRPRHAVDRAPLNELMEGPSRAFSFLPEVAFLQVLRSRGAPDVYSLIVNREHSNNAQLFAEADRRLPDEDTLTVAAGFIGAYPNMFFQVHERELGTFTARIMALESDADYTALVQRWGVRRTAPWFWKLSDDLNATYRADFPLEAGIFDLNRYENR